MKLAIIGYGRMGKLLAKNLSQDFDLFVMDKGEMYAIGAKCTHYGAPFIKGKQLNLLFQCTMMHGDY